MSIAQKIHLRHRSEGHLRFTLPPELSHAAVAWQIEAQLKQAEGVYRVDFYQRQGKLSIHYIEGVTDYKAVARVLFDAVTTIELPADPGGSESEADYQSTTDWMKAKYQEAKETFTAAGIVADKTSSSLLSMTPEKEKFIGEFFLDILVLYLIKLHWHILTEHWLKRPWQFRYEWTATFFLIMLLVRSKKPK
jgi:cation transport ATPase